MTYWLFATRNGDVRFLAGPHRSFIAGAAWSLVRQGWSVRTGLSSGLVSMEYLP